MLDTRDPQSLSDAASKAAAAGDYTSAEQLLREAVTLQEASLGPVHPDLANTLNNLGIVCEIVDKPADAEQCFRRASAIATEALPPDHPFVVTSRKNLEDFRAARGMSAAPEAVDPPSPPTLVDPPSAPTPVETTAPRHAETPAAAPVEAPAPLPDTRPAPAPIPAPLVPAPAAQRIPMGTIVAVVAILAVIAIGAGLRSRSRVDPTPASTAARDVSPPAPAPVPPAVTAAPTENPTTAAPPRTPREPAARAGQPTVSVARLCRELSRTTSESGDWQCASAGTPVGPGTLFFYTRLKSPVATAVQHRWYRGDTLQRVVELGIQPNTAEGYRTYSRTTVDGRGEWRVELRTKDGVLLHDERFVVR